MISKFLIFKRAYQSNGKKRVALIVDLLRSTQHVVVVFIGKRRSRFCPNIGSRRDLLVC